MNGSVFPVLIGPDKATVSFNPRVLEQNQRLSTVNIRVVDTNFEPVPIGTTLELAVSKGILLGGDLNDLFQVFRKDGRIVAHYLAPKRREGFKVHLDVILRGWYSDMVIGRGSIELKGPATNEDDPSLLERLAERLEILGDLNPLGFLISMRDLAKKAQKAGERRRRLIILMASGGVTDEVYAQAKNEYFKALDEFKLGYVDFVMDVSNTSIMGPAFIPGLKGGLSASVKGLYSQGATLGVRRGSTIVVKKSIRGSIKEVVKEYLVIKDIKSLSQPKVAVERGSSALRKVSVLLPVEVDSIQIDDHVWALKADTGPFELFGLSFRVEGTGGRVADGTVEVGDQAPLPLDFLPPELSFPISPNRNAVTTGIMEVTEVYPSRDALEGVVVGFVFQDPAEFPLIPFTAQIDSAGGSFAGGNGSQVNVPSGAVSQPTTLFLMEIPPPSPLSGLEDAFIASAYALGSVAVAPDTTIQKVTFDVPVELSLLYSQEEIHGFDEPRPHPYAFDEAQGRWVLLEETGTASSDTVRFQVPGTEIFGLGGKAIVSPVVSVEEASSEHVPWRFHLDNNFPNPFNATTVIRYALPEPSEVHLTIYDVLGRRVRTLTEGRQQPGAYQVVWDGRDDQGRSVGSGVYLYKLRAGESVKVRRMVLLR